MKPGRLTRLDEWPRHQLPRTFDTVASDSPHWSDGYWFALADTAGTLSLFTAIRLYPNTDVMDGYACVAVDGRQHNLRWSRRLRPAIDDLAVGPLALEVLRPLEELRTTCATNPHGISYDLNWSGLHTPYLEDYVERHADGRTTAQRCNYGQCCDVSGWVSVGGVRVEVGGPEWVGVRDHSWGLGSTGGPAASGVAPPSVSMSGRPPPARFAVRQWSMLRFADRVLFWQFHTDAGGRTTMFESRVIPRDGGPEWSYTGLADVDLSLIPGHRRLREGIVALTRPDGGVDRFRVQPVGSPVYLQGGGYWQGFADGLGRGAYRGEDHGEGEVWEVSDPSTVTGPDFRARPDAWAQTFATVTNLNSPDDGRDDTGFGHAECVIAGEHPDLV